MQLDLHEPPLDPVEPGAHSGRNARWLLLCLLALSLLGLGSSLYLRAHALVPPVTTRPIAIPAPVSVLASSQRSPYEAPGPDWRARVEQELARLRALHGPMPAPQPGDWVLSHPEPGQTFAEYLDGEPKRTAGPCIRARSALPSCSGSPAPRPVSGSAACSPSTRSTDSPKRPSTPDTSWTLSRSCWISGARCRELLESPIRNLRESRRRPHRTDL